MADKTEAPKSPYTDTAAAHKELARVMDGMEVSPYTFRDYLAMVSRTLLAHPQWRVGQAASNVLWHTHPELSDRLGDQTGIFYREDKVAEFLDAVKAAFEEETGMQETIA